jgi:hypothetical protein
MKKQILTIMSCLVLFQGFAQNTTTELDFLNKKSKVKKTNDADRQSLMTVIGLFENDTKSFYFQTESQKELFLKSTQVLGDKLSDSKKKANKKMAKQLKSKAAIFDLIWNSQNISAEFDFELPEETEDYTSL